MTLTFAVLGDSIAYGQGAARAADTVGARLSAKLAMAGTPTELRVFAVPGARSDALAGQVRRAVAEGADIALIVIGANDLTRFVAPQLAADQLGEAVRALRAADAQVVVAPAPDLSSVPWVPAQLRAVVRAGSADVDGSTAAAFAGDVSLFAADRFHPSSAGYALIADALAPAVFAAAADAVSRSA
jgi:lysophospholipase L1-like esterase